MRDLASVFAVEVLDYGVLDNSLQCLLKIRPDVAALWNDEDIARRWCKLNRQQLALNDVPPSQEKSTEIRVDHAHHRGFAARLSGDRQPVELIAVKRMLIAVERPWG